MIACALLLTLFATAPPSAERGDSALIDPLLAARAHSDGSMSDLLGGFLKVLEDVHK